MPKLQFSLRGFALAILIVGVVFSHAYTSRRLSQTETELSQLRQRHGYLNVPDPSKIEIQQVITSIEPYGWEWQLYMPDARDYEIHVATRDIPIEGFPNTEHHVIDNKGFGRKGTRTVRLALRKDPHGRWFVVCSGLSSFFRYPINKDDVGWLESGAVPHAFLNGPHGTHPADKPFELIRLRESRPIVSLRNYNQERLENGLLVWMKPL